MQIDTKQNLSQAIETTRLAPSPTGVLHLGNARTFLINAALATRLGWRMILRIEDLDTPRVKPGVIDETIEIMRWLGLAWDEIAPLQTADLEPYREAMRSLASLGLVYPCERTRGDIERAASAPNEGDAEHTFEPELRPQSFQMGTPSEFDREDINWRFAVELGRTVGFDDQFAGPQSVEVSATVGDFLVWTKRNQPSYQLAVVVDDARQSVTQIVRGDDLIPSAARQRLLWESLDFGTFPAQWHLPLVRGPDGRRLAKRHGDTRISTYRNNGVPAERIIGLIAEWCGVGGQREPMLAEDFIRAFDIRTMSRGDITFTEADEQWLIRN